MNVSPRFYRQCYFESVSHVKDTIQVLFRHATNAFPRFCRSLFRSIEDAREYIHAITFVVSRLHHAPSLSTRSVNHDQPVTDGIHVAYSSLVVPRQDDILRLLNIQPMSMGLVAHEPGVNGVPGRLDT
jgi:hypothetical protein